LSGLYYLLFSPNKGLFFFAPLCLLALWMGFRAFKDHRAEVVTVAIIVVSLLIATAMWWSWEGGSSWGPRLLFPLLPFLFIWTGTAWGKTKWEKAAFISLFAVGLGVNLLGVLLHFSVWNSVVSSGGQRFALDIKGRPSAEYIEKEGKKYFWGFVAANYIPALSQIRGNAWLLGIRYFERPVSIDAIASQSVGPMKPFPPLEVRFDAMVKAGSPSILAYNLQSAHFWWESHVPADDEVRPPPVLAKAFYAQGEKAAARKDFQRASYCYQQSLSLMPRSEGILVKLAGSYFQLKEWESGFNAYTSFIERNPDLPQPLFLFANLLEQTNQKATALSAYRLFQFRFPSHPLSSQVRQKIAALSISTH